MPELNSYLEVARDYADGVRVLFAPTGKPTGERGGVGPTSPEDLAAQAEKLSAVSDELTKQAENRLASEKDARAVAEASAQLLAKAITDLTVGAHLLQAAVDEDEDTPWTTARANERSITTTGSIEEMLQIVVGAAPIAASNLDRGSEPPPDIASARLVLSQTIEDTLAMISERTSKTGQTALGGLFGIGLGQVGQAAGLLGQNVAQVFGQADKLGRLYGLFRDFALKAYESVIALLGPAASKIVGQQVMNWIGEVKEATFLNDLLEKMYQTRQTREALAPMVKDSNADCQKFVTAIADIEKLSQDYSRQTALVDKLLKGIKYLGAVPVAIMPYGALLMAAIYVAICGYVVLNGADYVDADQIKFLDRVPGVRRVVVANLTTP
ncbi:MAG: hypothetical protein QOF62_3977 [Pyrinomonadaceae bacterium]|jgi:hypothetical protein|nr:hypothetical protein [Pyrinomonadaceae bacterium]